MVYVLRSEVLARTYVGIALDCEERLAQHNGAKPGGAKSTRQGRPWRIAREFGPFADRSEAQRVESQVKRLRGDARMDWQPGPDLFG